MLSKHWLYHIYTLINVLEWSIRLARCLDKETPYVCGGSLISILYIMEACRLHTFQLLCKICAMRGYLHVHMYMYSNVH